MSDRSEREPAITSDGTDSLPDDLRLAIGKLMPLRDQHLEHPEAAIPYEIQDYLELVDWSGRAIVHGKRGSIPAGSPPILERLKVNPEQFLKFVSRDRKIRFAHYLGPVEALRRVADRFGKSFLKGQTAAAALFNPG